MYNKLVTASLLIQLLALSIYNLIPLHTDILNGGELVTLYWHFSVSSQPCCELPVVSWKRFRQNKNTSGKKTSWTRPLIKRNFTSIFDSTKMFSGKIKNCSEVGQIFCWIKIITLKRDLIMQRDLIIGTDSLLQIAFKISLLFHK